MNSIDVTSSSPGKPVVYIIRHAEASGTAPEDPITPAWASQTEQLWERLWWEHEQLFLVCDTALKRCLETLDVIADTFPWDSIKEYTDLWMNIAESIARRVRKLLEDGQPRDAIVVCVSDCQIGDVAEKLGYTDIASKLVRIIDKHDNVLNLSGLRIGAHWVEAFRFSSCL